MGQAEGGCKSRRIRKRAPVRARAGLLAQGTTVDSGAQEWVRKGGEDVRERETARW